MTKNKITLDKKPLTVSVKLVIIQLLVVAFFTVSLLGGLIFNIGVFNVWYFLFMFGGTIGSAIIILLSKANPDKPIPKKPTQHLGNLIKTMTDIVSNVIGKPNQHPQIHEFKDVISEVLLWSLREAKINPEIFDQETLEEVETYIYDKLFPKKEGETESQSTG